MLSVVQCSAPLSLALTQGTEPSNPMVDVIPHRRNVPTIARICDEALLKGAVVPPALLPSPDPILRVIETLAPNSCTTLFGTTFTPFISQLKSSVNY